MRALTLKKQINNKSLCLGVDVFSAKVRKLQRDTDLYVKWMFVFSKWKLKL